MAFPFHATRFHSVSWSLIDPNPHENAASKRRGLASMSLSLRSSNAKNLVSKAPFNGSTEGLQLETVMWNAVGSCFVLVQCILPGWRRVPRRPLPLRHRSSFAVYTDCFCRRMYASVIELIIVAIELKTFRKRFLPVVAAIKVSAEIGTTATATTTTTTTTITTTTTTTPTTPTPTPTTTTTPAAAVNTSTSTSA